jgi:ribosomal protein S12 methylthiotransferase accessory factor
MLTDLIDTALAGTGWTIHTGPRDDGPAVVLMERWRQADANALAVAAHAGGHPVLPIRWDGALTLIGPVTGPGFRGCVSCAERARIAALPPGGPGDGAQHMGGACPPSAAALVATLAAELATSPEPGLVLAVRGDSPQVSAHRARAFGGCPVCAPLPEDAPDPISIGSEPLPDPAQLRLPNPRTTPEALRETLADWRLGPAAHLFRWEARPLPLVSAEIVTRVNGRNAGYGRATDFRTAERVALFEALERLTGMRPRRRRTTVEAAYRDLDPAVAVDPDTLGAHDPRLQSHPAFVLDPYHPDKTAQWVHAWSLTHDRPRLVPEPLAYWQTPRKPDGSERRMVYDSSNGCGLGNSLAEAILYGLLEVAERDAFLMAWYARTPLRRVAVPDDDPQTAHLADQLDALGHDLLLFDAGNDFDVPVVLSMTRRRDPHPDRPNTLFAAGAHPDPLSAIRAAAVEVVVDTRNAADPRIHVFDPDRLRPMLADPTLVRTLDDHVDVNALSDAADRHDFLLTGDEPAPWQEVWPAWDPPTDLGAHLADWVGRLGRAGLEVIAVDQTEPVTRDRLGLHAAKVIVPGSLPMTFGHVFRRTTGLDRLAEVPVRLGRVPSVDLDNLHPHPFP